MPRYLRMSDNHYVRVLEIDEYDALPTVSLFTCLTNSITYTVDYPQPMEFGEREIKILNIDIPLTDMLYCDTSFGVDNGPYPYSANPSGTQYSAGRIQYSKTEYTFNKSRPIKQFGLSPSNGWGTIRYLVSDVLRATWSTSERTLTAHQGILKSWNIAEDPVYFFVTPATQAGLIGRFCAIFYFPKTNTITVRESTYVGTWSLNSDAVITADENPNPYPETETNEDPLNPNDDPGAPGSPSIAGEGGMFGGFGDFDYHSDPVPVFTPPSISAAGTGLANIYIGSDTHISSLSQYLWAGAFNPDNFKKIFANPMDAILGLSLMPITGLVNYISSEIVVGNLSTGISMPRAIQQYVLFNAGNITLTSQSLSNTYIDCDPYTNARLVLPYIGSMEIEMADILDKTVGVRYNIDILTGTCVAMVVVDGSVLYSAMGNCATPIALTEGQFANGFLTISNLAGQFLSASVNALQGTVGISASTASKNPVNTSVGLGASSSGILGSIGGNFDAFGNNVALTGSLISPSMRRTGIFGSSSGLMGPQTPYFVFNAPKVASPSNQGSYVGFPNYTTESLNSCKGFTRVAAIHLGLAATEAEKDEITALLKSGVYL